MENFLSAYGMVTDGHFELASGKCSPQYVQKFNLLQYPNDVTAVVGDLIQRLRIYAPQWIVGPTNGGSAVAQEIARQMRVRWDYAEVRPSVEGGRRIPERYGQKRLLKNARVVIAEDVITTGSTVVQTWDAIERAGGKAVAIASLVDRSGGSSFFGNSVYNIPLLSAVTVDIPEYWPEDCPQCKEGVPLQKRYK